MPKIVTVIVIFLGLVQLLTPSPLFFFCSFGRFFFESKLLLLIVQRRPDGRSPAGFKNCYRLQIVSYTVGLHVDSIRAALFSLIWSKYFSSNFQKDQNKNARRKLPTANHRLKPPLRNRLFAHFADACDQRFNTCFDIDNSYKL